MKQKIKDFLKNNAAELYVGLCIIASMSAVIYITTLPKHIQEVTITKVVVTDVEFHPSGYVSVAQIDPEWKVKTNNGLTITSRHHFAIGDTLIIKKVKFGKLESK